QVPASWQASGGGQGTGAPPTQAPAPSQASVWVHELPSLQAVPAGFGTLVRPCPAGRAPGEQGLSAPQRAPAGLFRATQVPLVGSQAMLSWQAFGVGQVTGVPLHTPAGQTSCVVQALPSSQPVPSAALGLSQLPVAGSHVPATWHWSSG